MRKLVKSKYLFIAFVSVTLLLHINVYLPKVDASTPEEQGWELVDRKNIVGGFSEQTNYYLDVYIDSYYNYYRFSNSDSFSYMERNYTLFDPSLFNFSVYNYRVYVISPDYGMNVHTSLVGDIPETIKTSSVYNKIRIGQWFYGRQPSPSINIEFLLYRKVKNEEPTLNLSTANNQTLSEVVGYNTLTISGTVQDSDIGDILTVKYTINGLPTYTNKIITSLASNGANQPFLLNLPINPTIPESIYNLRAWVEDNKGGRSTEVVRTFTVDKTPPTPATISASPSGSAPSKTITIGFAGDAVTKQYRINSGSWLNYTGPFTITETSTINTRSTDSVGNTSTSSLSVEVAPPTPIITILSMTENSITIKDSQSYSFPVQRRFYCDGMNSGWTDESQYTFIGLNPNKKYTVKIEVQYK
jgi:hypothetical protein